MSSNWFDWLSFSWWKADVFSGFEYSRPVFIQLAWVVPFLLVLIGVGLFFIRSKKRFSGSDENQKFNPLVLLGLIPWMFFILSVVSILIALARPQRPNETGKTFNEGIDIVLTLDISGSMTQFVDIKPNRLEKTKELASKFVEGRLDDNVGMVVFAGDAFVKSPLTQDKELLQSLIKTCSSREINAQGTAIGSGCALGITLLKEAKGKSKVMILISDGDNNAGNVDPIQSAKYAQAYGIKVYTIGVGKKGRVPYQGGLFGVNYTENSFKETDLKEMAKITGGEYFRATSESSLDQIFNKIDDLETTKIETERFKFKVDYYQVYVFWSIVFLTLFVLLRSTFLVGMHRD